MQHPDKFETLLLDLGNKLQAQVIQRTGGILHGKVKHHERLPWRSPPLKTTCRLFGTPLQELVDLIYAPRIGLDAFTPLWDRAGEIIEESTPASVSAKLIQHFSEVLDFPFTPTAPKDTASILVQALATMSLGSGRRLCVGSRGAYLMAGGKLYEFSSHRLTSPLSTHRVKIAPSTTTLTQSLKIPLGKELHSSPRTTGAFRIVTRALPEQHKAVETLFSITVAAGRSYENTLNSLFDVEIDDDDTRSVWTEARQLVDFSEANPVRELYELLSTVFDRKVLIAKLGYPRHAPHRYTTAARCAHREVLDELEFLATGKKPTEAVKHLISIQNKLRG